MSIYYRCRDQGTTLFELLIIVTIVGILATLATSTFLVYRDKTRVATALTSSNTIRSALTGYTAAHPDTIYPDAIATYAELATLVNLHGGQLPLAEATVGLSFRQYTPLDEQGDGTNEGYTMSFRVMGVSPKRKGWCIVVSPQGTIKCDPV